MSILTCEPLGLQQVWVALVYLRFSAEAAFRGFYITAMDFDGLVTKALGIFLSPLWKSHPPVSKVPDNVFVFVYIQLGQKNLHF